jgi:hypothetical protein
VESQDFNLFLPARITKELSDGSLIVEGCASVADYVDSQDDIPDPVALKNAMTEWAPFGNIRAQHDPKQAIGTIRKPIYGKLSEELEPGWWMAKHPVTGTDAAFIRAHIVDTGAVRKFKANVFKGFSIGGQINPGGYKKEEIKVNGVKKTVRRLTDFSFAEISAVDKPACDLALVDSVSIAKRLADEPLTIRTVKDAERYANSIIERSRRKYGVPKSEVSKVLHKEGFNQPRPNSQTPPGGVSNLADLARSQIRVCLQHLGAAQIKSPGDKAISEAGMLCVSIDRIEGLGIASRFLEGGFSVPVSPDGESTDLTEALARVQEKSANVRMADQAGAALLFSKAYSTCREPLVMNRSEQLGYGQVFTKAAGKPGDDSGNEAQQILRRDALESAQARLKILGEKLDAAVTANPDSMAVPHLKAAQAAHREATKNINSCLNEEDGD